MSQAYVAFMNNFRVHATLTIKVEALDLSTLLLRSEHIVFVGARYKHVRSTNSKLRVIYIYSHNQQDLRALRLDRTQ